MPQCIKESDIMSKIRTLKMNYAQYIEQIFGLWHDEDKRNRFCRKHNIRQVSFKRLMRFSLEELKQIYREVA